MCNEDRSMSDFHKDKQLKSGISNRCKICNSMRNKKYRESNVELIKINKSEYYLKNKPRIQEKKRNYNKLNATSRRLRDYNYQKMKLSTDINYKLRHYLRSRIRSIICRNKRGGSAVKDLGCTIDELRQYLQSKFQNGMAWGNHGKWHIDHIKPLSKFDLTVRTDFLEACHYTNLQPLWAIENLIKGNKYIA